jgi:hypothetical protein
MAKREEKERFETQQLPPLPPVYSNTLREGIGVPFPEFEGESASEIAAKASGYIQELAARTKLRCYHVAIKARGRAACDTQRAGASHKEQHGACYGACSG